MDNDKMNEIIRDELKRIPRGEFEQNMLRMCYRMTRAHDLSVDPEGPRAEALCKAVEQVRKEHHGFSPNLLDPEYFGWSE